MLPWERYVTCCHCRRPLDDSPRMKDALAANNVAAWAKIQLQILADMAGDRGLPSWYVAEVQRIADGIMLMPER